MRMSETIAVLLLVGAASVLQANAQQNQKIEVVAQLGHSNRISSVAVSGDGLRVLSGSRDKTLKLWDVATGKLLRTFEGHSEVWHVAFSPNGRSLLSAGRDITLWDAAGKLLRTFETSSDSWLVAAFSPDGQKVISGSSVPGRSDNALQLWDVATGKLLRTFAGHSDGVLGVAFSPDGGSVLSGSRDKTLKLWDVVTGSLLRTLHGHSDGVSAIAFSPDGHNVISCSERNRLTLWDVATGRQLRTFFQDCSKSVAFTPDARSILAVGPTTQTVDVASGRSVRVFGLHLDAASAVVLSPEERSVVAVAENAGVLKLLDATTGELLRAFEGRSASVSQAAYSPDGRRVISASADGTLNLWDVATGRLTRTFGRPSDRAGESAVAFSPDGRSLVSGSGDGILKFWDITTGKLRHSVEGHGNRVVASVSYSPDGRRVVSGGHDWTFKIWDAASAKLVRGFRQELQVMAVAFSPDGRSVISDGGGERALKLWDVGTGNLLRAFPGDPSYVLSIAFSRDGHSIVSGSSNNSVKLWDVATGKLRRTFEGHSDAVWAVAFSPDARSALSGSSDRTLKLWNVGSGDLLRTLNAHLGPVKSVAFAPNGINAASASLDGTVRLWSLAMGRELVQLLASPDGDSLALTPVGFFDFKHNFDKFVHIVRGMELFSIGQMHQSLFNPDLVREALAGDPGGEVVEAAKVINLEKVLDSGPAPTVEITSHRGGSQTASDLVTVAARITDKGRGIGRIEWRVNGVTAAVSTKAAGSGPEYPVTQELALDPGENEIEVLAYNGSNLLASLPARTTVAFTGPVDETKPKLHVLVIGIDEYIDKGWIDRRANRIRKFLPLNLAVKDAQAFGAAMERAGNQIYQKVNVIPVLNKDATLQNLEDVIRKMAKDVHRRDTFVFFAAAHGISEDGRFYLIPQDYHGGPGALQQHAISQDRLQDWLANRIRAKKAIILLDTCESGALVAGYLRSRTEEAASEAGVGRLHEATGRPVLTAAAGGQFAHEGVVAASGERQGIFTRTILDALKSGDTNNNGKIELSELVAYVQAEVPKLAAKFGGTARAETATTKRQGQSARFGSRGEDFVLVTRIR
jgi:WD40 repeat protein